MDPKGNLTSDQTVIDKILFSYFSQLFATSNPLDIDFCIQAIPICIFQQNNRLLLVEFTEQEVKEALFMMNSLGAEVLIVFQVGSIKSV